MMRDIVIAGVGGQGALLASRILGNLALRLGRDVKVSEIHGMAQRGGSVITHVRIADMDAKVLAPLVTQGEADVILAFEPLEALRSLPYLTPSGGLVITSTRPIPPMSVLTGAVAYPTGIIQTLEDLGREVIAFDAQAMADKHSAPRAVNIALLGALAARVPFALEDWEAAVKDSVPPKSLETNLAVFHDAYDTARR